MLRLDVHRLESAANMVQSAAAVFSTFNESNYIRVPLSLMLGAACSADFSKDPRDQIMVLTANEHSLKRGR